MIISLGKFSPVAFLLFEPKRDNLDFPNTYPFDSGFWYYLDSRSEPTRLIVQPVGTIDGNEREWFLRFLVPEDYGFLNTTKIFARDSKLIMFRNREARRFVAASFNGFVRNFWQYQSAGKLKRNSVRPRAESERPDAYPLLKSASTANQASRLIKQTEIVKIIPLVYTRRRKRDV